VEAPRANDGGAGYAVPRASLAPPANRNYGTYGPVYRGGTYRWEGPYYAPHFVGRSVIRPWNPVRFYSPYYAFRPRVALGSGLWAGYPVAYPYGWYDPFAYASAFPRPVTRNAYGGVSFDVDPRDAAIYIDGEYIGYVDEFGPYDAPLTLPVGLHRVDVRAPGYRTLSFDVSVAPG